jgi:hypothetical protein
MVSLDLKLHGANWTMAVPIHYAKIRIRNSIEILLVISEVSNLKPWIHTYKLTSKNTFKTVILHGKKILPALFLGYYAVLWH